MVLSSSDKMMDIVAAIEPLFHDVDGVFGYFILVAVLLDVVYQFELFLVELVEFEQLETVP